MSILKSNNGNPDACNRYTFACENAIAGEDISSILINVTEIHFQALKANQKLVAIPDDMDEFAELLWNSPERR